MGPEQILGLHLANLFHIQGAVPHTRNKLAKCSPSIAIFKHKIKTHLFKLAYHSKFLESFCFYYFLIVYIYLDEKKKVVGLP